MAKGWTNERDKQGLWEKGEKEIKVRMITSISE
jgi:hypothetical protein